MLKLVMQVTAQWMMMPSSNTREVDILAARENKECELTFNQDIGNQ